MNPTSSSSDNEKSTDDDKLAHDGGHTDVYYSKVAVDSSTSDVGKRPLLWPASLNFC